MATIDTYVVKIQPNFDTTAFRNIKTKIESLSKLVKNIPMKVVVNNKTLTGVKGNLQSAITRAGLVAKIPVKVNVTSGALVGVSTALKAAVTKSGVVAKIPVTTTIMGARADLVAKLAKLKKPSLQIPVVFSLKGSVAQLRGRLKKLNLPHLKIPLKFITIGSKDALQAQLDALDMGTLTVRARLILRDMVRPRGGNGGGNGGGGGNDQNRSLLLRIASNTLRTALAIPKLALSLTNRALIGPAMTIARYGVGGMVAGTAGKMIASPFIVQDRIVGMKARDPNVNIALMKDSINRITQTSTTMASDLAETALSMVKADVSVKRMLGSTTKLDMKNSLLKTTSDLASIEGELPQQVFDLLDVLDIAFKGQYTFDELGDKVWAMLKVSKYSIQQIKQLVSSAGIETMQNIGMDSLIKFIGVQSKITPRPSDAGTSMKVFETFTRVATSKKSEQALDTLGLSRYNAQGTKVGNFMNFFKQLVGHAKAFKEGGGEAVINGNKINIKDYARLLKTITGMDAIRFAGLARIENVDTDFERMQIAINNADYEAAKQFILSASPLKKLQMILSNLETAFGEAFDLETLKAVGDLAQEVVLKIKEFVLYLKKVGGLSGMWKEFKDSEFMAFLERTVLLVERLMDLLNITDVKISNSFVGPPQPTPMQEGGFINDILKFMNIKVTQPHLIEKTPVLNSISNSRLNQPVEELLKPAFRNATSNSQVSSSNSNVINQTFQFSGHAEPTLVQQAAETGTRQAINHASYGRAHMDDVVNSLIPSF
ncbi:phage tail tape measure protein [bacterium]|nr:phage tail tape measure protein [bacterium]